MSVAILGAGLSGVSIASLIKNSDITIYEREEKIGGLCRSKTEKGYTYDLGGSHIIFSRKEEILQLMLKILNENVIKNRRNTKIFLKNLLIKYPYENGLNCLSKEDRLECLIGYINAVIERQLNPDKKPANFHEWQLWKFGEGIANQYLIPYNRKIWKYPLEEMDNFWVLDRIPDPKVEDLLKAAMEMETEGYVHQLEFYYPKVGGIQTIVDGLVKSIKPNLLLNQNIETISRIGNVWQITANRKTRKFENIISTIPLPELIKLLTNVPFKIQKACSSLKTNSLINIFVGVKGLVNSRFKDISWLYIPDEGDGLFHRLSFPSNFSKLNAPIGHSGITMEITCLEDSEVWDYTDEKLIGIISNQLEKLGIIKSQQIDYYDINRWKYAYVIFDLEYKKNIEIVIDYLTKIGIIPFGRFGLYEYLNMDHILSKAIELAKKINTNEGF